MIVIGMTGPIGHGKTTLANALEKLVPSTKHFESSMVVAEVANALHDSIKDIPDPNNIETLNNWLRSLPAILLGTVHTHCTFEQIMLDELDIAKHPIEYQKLILHVENLKRRPELIKQEITRENKETYRPFLQWLGGYLVQKVDNGIWYNEIVRRVYLAESEGYELCIVGGLRFPSDAAILRKAGATIVKVYRPSHLQNDMLDPTERERDNIKVDCTIMSNGDIEDVERFAKRFLDDVRGGNVQQLYQTKD